MRGEASFYDAFENLGDEVKVGYKTVAGQVIGRKGVFFEDGTDQGKFERVGKGAGGE